jgi:hypothetical protein
VESVLLEQAIAKPASIGTANRVARADRIECTCPFIGSNVVRL